MIKLRHGRIELALHELRSGDAPRLLLLHGLGERSPESLPPVYAAWPGAVYALDFAGHGASTVPRGGGYHPEMLMGDADVALAELGPCTVSGRGLGAYVALMIAGGRPQLVRGAILLDGPGLAGGGSRPGSQYIPTVDPAAVAPPDPLALLELSQDLRPPDYVTTFSRMALEQSDLERPISVCAREHPDWLAVVLDDPGVEQLELDAALRDYSTEDAGGRRP